MTDGGSQAGALPIPIHVALRSPGAESDDAPPALGAFPFGSSPTPSPLSAPSLDWSAHGVEPRWLGQESSDCAAALQASVVHGQGAAELERFLAGAETRGETALLINTLGATNDGRTRSIFGSGASLLLPGMNGMINARPAPTGVQPNLVEDLGSAERDLGLWLLQHAGELAWHSLSLGVTSLERAGGAPERRHAKGSLEPILVDGLGAPLAAVWVSGPVRWYVLPHGTDWELVLDWLVTRALPEHVPGALRRARLSLASDPGLQSAREIAAREALQALEVEYERRRADLQAELAQATAKAEPLRAGLLHGTAGELVAAVAQVLQAAGCQVIDLDRELGRTVSADLLVSHEGESRLVEVKSAAGNAGEQLVGALYRHLDTWPQLRPDLPVGGGVLVVNHQHRLDPAERDAQVYSRPEFVASLRVPVVGSRSLFDWWRRSDWEAIRAAVFKEI